MIRLAALLLAAWSLDAASPRAFAQHIGAHSFGENRGLEDDAIRTLVPALDGTLLVGTERGLYDFNGNTFSRFDKTEGLPPFIETQSIATDAAGRLAIADDRQVFAADGQDTSQTVTHRPLFIEITPPPTARRGIVRRLAWWKGSLLGEVGQKLAVIIQSGGKLPAQAVNLPIIGLATAGDTLAVSTLDGRICRITDATLSCASAPDTTAGHEDVWTSLAIAPDGTIYGRSSEHFATWHPDGQTLAIEAAHGEGYENTPLLALQPDGLPIIWASGHLQLRTHDGWRALTLPITLLGRSPTAIRPGTHGELWLAIPGAGLVELPNYRTIVNYDAQDGLALGEIWQFSRTTNNALLIGATRGIVSLPDPLHPHLDTEHPAIANADLFAAFPDGTVWARQSLTHLLHTHLNDHRTQQTFPLAYIRKLMPDGTNHMDILTNEGLYVVADAMAADAHPQHIPGVGGFLMAALRDEHERLWLAHADGLDVRLPDGRVEHALIHWPVSMHHVSDMVEIDPQTLWIGGQSGILVVRHDGTHVSSSMPLDNPLLKSRSVYSFIRDANGHVWVGTDHGLFVQDGPRWSIIDAQDGLIWNDVDQDSLFLDADRSLWVGTTIGFSHILRPQDLLPQPPLQTRILGASIGQRQEDMQDCKESAPYSHAPLRVTFEALPITRADGLVFHYRLHDVDPDWSETSANSVRYPFLPAGRHLFEVYTTNPHTGERSPTAGMMLCMRKPWWLFWPVEALYGLGVVLFFVCLILLQAHLRRRQQRILLHKVDQKTRELTAAKLALELEARTDSVTGLMNRRTIQTLLSDQLDFTHRKNARALRKNVPEPDTQLRCMIALFDIDHFKRINDQHGHLIGDQVLREIGDRFRDLLAPGEYCGRYGGEEFLLVLTNDPSGIVRISTLAGALTRQSFGMTGTPFRVTLSVGIADARREDNWESLIDRADKALYDAKAGGRDQIIVAP